MPRPGSTLLLFSVLVVPVALGAQAPSPRRHVVVPTVAPRAEDVATVDGIVKAYYDVITGPAGTPRQWGRDRSLYIPNVRFVATGDRKSTRLNSSHGYISYAVFCLKK